MPSLVFDGYKPFGEEYDDEDEILDDPDVLDDPNSLKLSLVYRGDKIRILTNILNISDWRIFCFFV